MEAIPEAEIVARRTQVTTVRSTSDAPSADAGAWPRKRSNRVLWLKLNFTVKTARLQTLKRQKYQHLQEEALLKARGLLKNWEDGVVVLTEDLYRRAAGERDAQELLNYTPEALALRFSLRNDPMVLEAVKQLWMIEMPRDEMGCIDQRGYASVFRRIAKSLDAKAFRKKRLDRLLDEDWKRDSKGESEMSFANFFDSIFELADLWCETIDADDYVSFLERLRDRISQMRSGKRVLRPMKRIGAFDADSDEDEEEEEEDDSSDDEAQAKKKEKPVVSAAPAPRFLTAKAIGTTQRPSTIMKRVGQAATAAVVSSRRVRPTVVQQLPAPVDPEPVQMDMRNQQRRGSVITTIQFGDGLLSRPMSASEAIHSLTPHLLAFSEAKGSSAGLVSSSSQAHLMTDRQRFSESSPTRQSLAMAAAAALASSRERNHSTEYHSIELRSDSIASANNSAEDAQSGPASGDRKRIYTVSTAKRAMLSAIGALASLTSKRNATDQLATGLRQWPEPQLQEEEDEELGLLAENTRESNAILSTGNQAVEVVVPRPEAIETSVPGTRGLRGYQARSPSPKMRSLAPLTTSNHSAPTRSAFNTTPQHTTATSNVRQVLLIGKKEGVGGLNLADSVVMTSYVVERPTVQQHRPRTVLSPASAGRTPGGITRTPSSSSMVRGAAVLKPMEPSTLASPSTSPPQGRDDEENERDLNRLRMMYSGMNSSPPLTASVKIVKGKSTHDTALDRLTSAHGDGAHHESSELKVVSTALHIPDQEGQVLPHRATTDHTLAGDEHANGRKGLIVRSLESPQSRRTDRVRNHGIDPMGAPWGDWDDENNAPLPESHFLRHESAFEALSKLRNQQNKHKKQAKSSRRGRGGLETRLSGRWGSDEEDDYYDAFYYDNPDEEKRLGTSPILTVAALGGTSVDTGRRKLKAVKKAPKKSEGYEDDATRWKSSGLQGVMSAPALSTVTDLGLNYLPPSPSERNRTRITVTVPLTPMIQLRHPNDRASTAPVDFELRGDAALESDGLPPTTSPSRLVHGTSPRQGCTCSYGTNGSPQYKFDKSRHLRDDQDEGGGHSPMAYSFTCPVHGLHEQRANDGSDATMIVNETREIVLKPRRKEEDVVAKATIKLPRRSEMMKRRYRYAFGRK
ncbi:hypothetical protein Poli38472_013220 [Pythium oligandrum]|uniref:Uncharacterized protein n=1 Tax=Pythium oligandrum TaxID=41045 RepID=A0A8K1C2L4_PYTOL|nr:hypothetical protein Poli38472_013220 [Pythium oligandrum]|eukprot:TMW55329.1 hypothetical protein Poli38472_013220 [Pythium oligandrum]